MSTLEKVEDYISDARTLLQDTVAPYRYDDDSLIVSLNTTLLEARRLRADLFAFQCDGKVPHFTSVDDEPLCIEQPFRLAILYGLVGHAMMRDQEDIQDHRASTLLSIMQTMLTGVRLPPLEARQ